MRKAGLGAIERIDRRRVRQAWWRNVRSIPRQPDRRRWFEGGPDELVEQTSQQIL